MWTPTAKGVDEARVFAIMGLIQGNISTLNTVLTYDGLWPSQFVITETMVHYGDVEILPDRATAPIYFCVEGGDNDSRIQQDTAENTWTNGTVRTLETYIYVYIHPKVLPEADYEAKREQILSRICDWLTDGLFNHRPNMPLILGSKVFVPSAESDKLRGIIRRVNKDWFRKDYGGMIEVRGALLTHEGYVG